MSDDMIGWILTSVIAAVIIALWCETVLGVWYPRRWSPLARAFFWVRKRFR